LVTKSIKVVNIENYSTLIQDLVDTAVSLQPNCLGLAANQIWKEASTSIPAICVVYWYGVDQDDQGSWKILINPEGSTSGKHIKQYEGCVSFPGRAPKLVSREKNLTLTFKDLLGFNNSMKVTGLLSRVIQHELDHLNGELLWKN
jgi:peptide deformylase